MELLIVRHGESLANAEDRMQGQKDYPLSEIGVEQASLLGRWLAGAGLRFDAAYTSPLRRARDTSRFLTNALGMNEAELVTDLQELNAGALEGLRREEMGLISPSFLERPLTERGDFSAYGGESYADVQTRMRGVLRTLEARHRAANHRVLLVAHGGTNFHLLKLLVCEPVPRVMSLKFGNCTQTLVRMRERAGFYLGEVLFHVPIELLGGRALATLPGIF